MNAETRSLVRRRARALAEVTFLVAFVAVPSFAFAGTYPGQEALEWAARYIIAPLGLFSIVIALGAAFFRPEYVKQAINAVIICAILFFIIQQGESIFKALGKQ